MSINGAWSITTPSSVVVIQHLAESAMGYLVGVAGGIAETDGVAIGLPLTDPIPFPVTGRINSTNALQFFPGTVTDRFQRFRNPHKIGCHLTFRHFAQGNDGFGIGTAVVTGCRVTFLFIFMCADSTKPGGHLFTFYRICVRCVVQASP